MKDDLLKKCKSCLDVLCLQISDRSVGSEGNRQATHFINNEFSSLGWTTEMPSFDAIDWIEKGAILRCGEQNFNVLVSPYSIGFRGEGQLVSASDISQLQMIDAKNRILFLNGEIALEQLMPKNFVFYNPEHHQKIISLLEKSGAKAVISATGRNAALAGGAYPFPLIEDGDFDIPSVYMTEEEGEKLKGCTGRKIFLESFSERIPGKGYNVIATRGGKDQKKIVITAHADSKKGTPGAIDNATGVIVLLLLAGLLKDYSGNRTIELVAFNGEDYYAVPGQMNYIASNQAEFGNILLNINIDGAGYYKGPSAFSRFDLPAEISNKLDEVKAEFQGIEEGTPWPQGDHSIFLQFGVPAIAVSSKWFTDNINDQDITHTPKDNPDIVDCGKVVEIAMALNILVRKL
jgi:aminopeptidase YwaD